MTDRKKTPPVKINQQAIDRLEPLYTFLEKMDNEKFYFGDFVSEFDEKKECGTVCCALGWMPAIDPTNFYWDGVGLEMTKEESEHPGFNNYFNLSEDSVDHLFYPTWQLPEYPNPLGICVERGVPLDQYLIHLRAFIDGLKAGDYTGLEIPTPEPMDL